MYIDVYSIPNGEEANEVYKAFCTRGFSRG